MVLTCFRDGSLVGGKARAAIFLAGDKRVRLRKAEPISFGARQRKETGGAKRENPLGISRFQNF